MQINNLGKVMKCLPSGLVKPEVKYGNMDRTTCTTHSRHYVEIKSIMSNECKVGEGMQINPTRIWMLNGSGARSMMSR